MERFSGVAGRNFTKLELNIVKLSIQDQFVLEFRKLSPFLHKDRRQTGRLQKGFRQSYIVPVPKVKDCRIKSMTCNDFRGIAISPIVSKIFEYCILHRFNQFLGSCDVQIGFKKGLGCRNAIYTVRKIIDRYVEGGSTVIIILLLLLLTTVFILP